MSMLPIIPVNADKYLADTAHMTNEEAGAYFRLQVFAWRTPGCCLPDDDARFARMLGTTPKRWAALKPIVLRNWTLIDGNWINDQIAIEHEIVAEKVEKKRASGRQGGRPKPLELHETGKALGSVIAPQSESETKALILRSISTPIVPTENDPEGFADFRSTYPKRNVTFPTTLARRRWREATRRGASPEEIITGARAYAAEQARIGKVGTEFVKTADAWLNQQRWRDFLPRPEDPSATPAPAVTDEVWRDRVQRWKATGGHWPWKASEPPDSPNTAVPKPILDEFGISRPAGGDRMAAAQHRPAA